MQSTMYGKQIMSQEAKMIQFHGIKTIYPVNERIPCVFTIPEVCQPECGDWIGIFPVGWTSIVRDCLVRQMVPVERHITGQYCQVEFEPFFGCEQKYLPHQQYQFVYVNNKGEYTVLGKSMPFRFNPIATVEEQLYEKEIMTTMPLSTVTGVEVFGINKYARMPVTVETEMHKLEKELIKYEQQGLWNLVGQQQQQPTMIAGPYGAEWIAKKTTMQPVHLVKSVEQILKEKIRVEQAQRRIEQLCVLAQLKSFERHIACVQKREAEIRDYLLRAKIQAKIAAFEQKVQQVIREKYTGIPMTTSVEQYVRKYEQLLREKIQLDMEKRRVVLHKLRVTIRDCERRLRELQTIDQEHLVSFHSLLKGKFEQFNGSIMRMPYGVETGAEWSKHFETVCGSFLLEQEKVAMNLMQVQRELVYMCNEICAKLQEVEIVDCYQHFRIPRITTSLMFASHPKLMQIVQLERKIAEQKLKLKLRMLQQTGLVNGNVFGGRFVEQLTRGIWFTPIIEKLRMIQYHLAKFPQVNTTGRFYWFEKKQQLIAELISKLTQFQTEVLCHTGVFDQIKLRQVLVQLSELRERECMEIPRFFQQPEFTTLYPTTVYTTVQPMTTMIVDLCEQMSQLVGEKCGELTTYMQWFQPKFFQMQEQMPFECLFATLGWQYGQPEHFKYGPAMLELFEIERKLTEMKALTLASVQYMHLNERLVELEHIARIGGQQFWLNQECQLVGKRFAEKLRQFKSLIGEHIVLNNVTGEFELYPQQPISQYLPTGFLTVPEHFFQHQHKYEKMCAKIAEIECHLVELPIVPVVVPVEYETVMPQYYPTGLETTVIPQLPVFGGEYYPTTQYNKYNTVFGGEHKSQLLVAHRFLRLVQEFQMQFPECFAPKCEEICAFLRHLIVEKKFVATPVRGIEQLLRERLIEFESILCQPECEIACLTTVIFPQSTTATFKTQRECLKYLIRQVREVKSQLINGQWTGVLPTIAGSIVPPMTTIKGEWIEQQQQQQPLSGVFGENKLVDLWNKKMWAAEKPTTVVETTTTNTTVGQQQYKTITTTQVPTGLVRPITIEKIEKICGEQQPIIPVVPFGKRFASQYELVGEELCGEQRELLAVEDEINNNWEWEQYEVVEPCLCQMEKYIRKVQGLPVKPEQWIQATTGCPLCNVVDTTVEKTITGVRRF